MSRYDFRIGGLTVFPIIFLNFTPKQGTMIHADECQYVQDGRLNHQLEYDVYPQHMCCIYTGLVWQTI